LLGWTAAINVFLLLVRGLDFLVFRRLQSVELFPSVAVGAGLAVGSLFAMWSALGKGHLLMRVGVLLATGIAGGYAMQVLGRWCAAWLALPNQWSYHLLWLVSSLGGLWTVWFGLAVCFLAALLVVFRSSGYCLAVQGRRTTGTP
jgi:hypothetical protein